MPIGKEDNFEGVIDLITMKAIYFDGNNGENVRREAIPAELKDEAARPASTCSKRWSMYSDELMELLLAEEEVPEELIHEVVREAVQSQDVTPVFMGTAYRNKGVQPLLDAIVRYLPSPLRSQRSTAKNYDDPTKSSRSSPIRPSRSSAWRSRSSKIRTAS